MMLKIQYSSDIHQEFKPISIIPKLFKNVNADILVLCGDICAINAVDDYNKFLALLSYYSPKYKYIIMIAGNHEFYTTTRPVQKSDCIDSVHRKFKAISKIYPNYLYLNCDTVTLTINDKLYTFAGCTLWTKINNDDKAFIMESMNDYSNIFYWQDNKINTFNVDYMQVLHKRNKAFIKKSIAVAAESKLPLILLTHHKPLLENTNNTRLNQAYETDMSDIIKAPIKAVLWGHTHIHMNKVINNIIYATNPRGYPHQRTNFRDDLIIELS